MAEKITLTTVQGLLPPRPEDGHKGTFGHAFVIGGSRGFTGAVKLASLAAARSGTGLVTAGIPKPLGDCVAASLLEIMTLMLDATPSESIAREAVAAALSFAQSKEAVILGPGLSQDPSTQAFVLDFVRACPSPLLIDADGLNALGEDLSVLEAAEAPIVLTPHPGEMGRLTGLSAADIQAAREETAHEFAAHHGCVVVLKGRETVITDGTEVYINTTGNSGLATGGTGDVLSGVIGGLMAQGLGPLDASLLGVFCHGLAGDIAARRMGERAMLAGDLIDAFPEAWRVIEPAVAS